MTSIKFRALAHDDHKYFFEALGEYGKDFQNIQQYMAQKSGVGNKNNTNNKTSATSASSSSSSADQNNKQTPLDGQEKRDHDKKEEDKKREQIRNFYNKLYTKLSQLVVLTGKIDDRVEKVNQELYLLINYGEIWKKHGFKFNNKTKKLLEELVFQGYTTLRFKNKNVRLRTPPCKALKKINGIGIDEKEKVVTSRELPKEVIVEFHPATNRDWLKVQSMSQNPLVRARLSIQKRLTNILEFLENKWNVSQEKLNRTVDVWLKVPVGALTNQAESNNPNSNPSNGIASTTPPNNGASRAGPSDNPNSSNEQITDNGTNKQKEALMRLRLKPSAQHELKEVNITRVVPDNHLDLSLNAYIKRMGDVKPKVTNESTMKPSATSNKDNPSLAVNSCQDVEMAPVENCEMSQGALSTGSHHLPLSLTTPDCSLLFERSCTSDQPNIASQARKHLNLLQSLAGTFEGCENSRTACEETQDRLLLGGDHSRSQFGYRVASLADKDCNRSPNKTTTQVTTIPSLFDEDAAIDTNLSAIARNNDLKPEHQLLTQVQSTLSQHHFDSQNSKSVDFHIPKNVTLGDWFKMNGQGDNDDANDAFPTSEPEKELSNIEAQIEMTPIINDDNNNDSAADANPDNAADVLAKSKQQTPEAGSSGAANRPHNHMIEIQRLAEGWTRQDEPTITIGELYLAFKCPEKIVLEYGFEHFAHSESRDQSLLQGVEDQGQTAINNSNSGTHVSAETPSNDGLMFKLLTAASLSLAHIGRQKQEQQHRLQDQSNNAKCLKRRKSQGQVRSLQDIEMNNQRVEEALKRLKTTKLTFKPRAR